MRTSAAIATAILFGCTAARPVQAAENQAYSRLYSVEVVDESGTALPTFEHLGRAYVLGTLGQRYLVRVTNRSAQRVEVVTSVDGRDVLDGRPAAWNKRGYIVDAYGGLVIDGFRLNQEAVAAFRFSSVPRSYAAQMGSARDVGVIGVAVFPERQYFRPPPVRRDPGKQAATVNRSSSARLDVKKVDARRTPRAGDRICRRALFACPDGSVR